MNGGVNKGNFNNNGRPNCTSIVSSSRITCDEISVRTNGLTVNGSINCGVINANGPILASSNIAGDPRFKVNNSASQEILSVNNNGKITCKGLECKNADITIGQTLPNATITQAGDVTCQALSCSGLTVNTVVYRHYKEIVALASVKSTTVTLGSSFISPWSYTYTSSGGKLK